MTVDGGTDRWISWLNLNNIDIKTVAPPDRITGDMDSVLRATLDNFIGNGTTTIIETPNQNETDFTKALRQLDEYCNSSDTKIDEIYVIVDSCGRLDQIMANLNTLYYARNIVPYANVYQLSTHSLCWLLSSGTHTIHIPKALRNYKEWCGLIPLSACCLVTTSGLKWNLENSIMKFGQLVSTSNTYDDNLEVKIQTDNTILWTMGIEHLFKNNLNGC